MKQRLLIIEPDILLGSIYKSFLSKKYIVNVCNDGQQAIDLIDKQKPDAIVLELQLIAHNGYEFLYELRSYKEWFEIPVIINSLIPENKNNYQELGIKDYLYKPTTSLEKLLDSIDRQLLVSSI
jgi:DNA-binding response OmpR family regulator